MVEEYIGILNLFINVINQSFCKNENIWYVGLKFLSLNFDIIQKLCDLENLNNFYEF